MTIAILGTGLLGAGMVRNLLAKGEAVRVWNRTADKAEALAADGAEVASSPADAVRGARRVHLVLTADDAVDEVLGACAPALEPGCPVYDHSTNLPDRVAARHERSRAAGIAYFHAPVFMAPVNARDGTGLMLLSASAAEHEAALPSLQAMTGKIWHVGERPDLAAVYKLIGNALLVSISGAFGDLFALGANQGLDPAQVLQIFDHWRPGAMLPAFGQRVAARGTNPVSWELVTAAKDVRLMVEAAGGADGLVVLPALAVAMQAALAEGHGQRDYAIFAWPRGRQG